MVQSEIQTPLGKMIAIACDEQIVLCDFVDRTQMDAAIARTIAECQHAATEAAASDADARLIEPLRQQLHAYFDGQRTRFDLPVLPRGTDFEMKAWAYLQTIPFGQTRTYGQQAKDLGTPLASRAVGRANGMNFLSILIPCHRVIGANGSLTGYGGGIERKKWLLDHERRHCGDVNIAGLFDDVRVDSFDVISQSP